MQKLFIHGLMVVSLGILPVARADTFFTLDPPDGSVTGAPGSIVGWGFTFSNDANYAVITGSQFCASTSSPLPDVCQPLSPDLGTYTDFAGAQFLVIGPSPENPLIIQSFDSLALTGIGSFAIDPSATGTVSGIVTVTYDLYSVSPNDPDFTFDDQISGGNFLTADASVTVSAGAAIPEPSSISLLTLALLIIWYTRQVGRAALLKPVGPAARPGQA